MRTIITLLVGGILILMAACAPATPVIPQTGPETDRTAAPGDTGGQNQTPGGEGQQGDGDPSAQGTALPGEADTLSDLRATALAEATAGAGGAGAGGTGTGGTGTGGTDTGDTGTGAGQPPAGTGTPGADQTGAGGTGTGASGSVTATPGATQAGGAGGTGTGGTGAGTGGTSGTPEATQTGGTGTGGTGTGGTGSTGGTGAATAQPGAGASAGGQAGDDLTYTDLVAQLGEGDAAVQEGEMVTVPYFNTQGRQVTVDGNQLTIFEFPSVQAREEASRAITENGGIVGANVPNWMARPNFYAQGQVIVLYLGSDQETLDLLNQAVGPALTYSQPMGALSPDAAFRIQSRLSDLLGVRLDQIRIVNVTQQEWQDSCLGLGGPEESCLQAVTPGYAITVEANNTQYQVRTDTTGSVIRWTTQ